MRFKTDENVHPDAAQLLRMAGHDVLTVWDEHLDGTPDSNLARVCQQEGRPLITLDLDFSDIRAYPPEQYHGIIVLRLGSQARAHVVQATGRVVLLLATHPLDAYLWIVDEVSVRIRGGNP